MTIRYRIKNCRVPVTSKNTNVGDMVYFGGMTESEGSAVNLKHWSDYLPIGMYQVRRIEEDRNRIYLKYREVTDGSNDALFVHLHCCYKLVGYEDKVSS